MVNPETVRSCLLCTHCNYIPSEPGYSEYTPGCDAQLWCMKRVMRHAKGANLFAEAYTRQQLQEALHTAATCPHYTLEPENR